MAAPCDGQDAAKAGASKPAAPETSSSSTADPEPELPPLSPEQFRVYNRLAVTMNYFHDHFRRSWNILYGACESGRRPSNMSLKQFIDEGLHLTQYLTAHHGIEEAHIFPLLGRKMPEFRSGGKGGGGPAGELVRQHRQIHAGMDMFEEYLRKCRNREVELELSVMKEKMDSWGPVLLTHLDQEVDTLRAENMRKYWTMEEMRAIPM
ncbi:hypothetical protein GQ53DRAFT_671189 [Thozetella sp. PMI_491]|nr:hypothetical protein GQ53DRAFT_671189 [Thozetella sp. PMI_491]